MHKLEDLRELCVNLMVSDNCAQIKSISYPCNAYKLPLDQL